MAKLPQGWIECELRDFAYINMGQSPIASTYNEDKIGIPFFQGRAEFGKDYPTIKKWCSKPIKIAEDGDILLSVRAPVGTTNICPQKSCIGRGLAAIKGLNHIDNRFIRYLLTRFEYKMHLVSTGTTFKAISGDNLKQLKLPLPPLNEQQRIVGKIESEFKKIDEGLEYLLITKDKIKQYRQSVLKSAFEGKLIQQNHGDEPAEILLQKINPKANCIHNDKLPQGWVECQLGQVFEIVTGKTPSKKHPEYFNGNIPFVKPGDLDKKIYITKTEDDSLTLEGFKNAPNLPKNTVLVSCIGNLGKKAILGIAGSCNQQINAIIPNDFIENKYVYYYIDKIIPWLEKNSSATTVKILNKGKFEQAPFLLPPQNEQRRIVEEIETRFALADKVEKVVDDNIKQAKQLKQSILKKAFEGRLVPQDPTDEPASVLLEKIKKEKNYDRK